MTRSRDSRARRRGRDRLAPERRRSHRPGRRGRRRRRRPPRSCPAEAPSTAARGREAPTRVAAPISAASVPASDPRSRGFLRANRQPAPAMGPPGRSECPNETARDAARRLLHLGESRQRRRDRELVRIGHKEARHHRLGHALEHLTAEAASNERGKALVAVLAPAERTVPGRSEAARARTGRNGRPARVASGPS